jgi:hypothetical protein
MELQALPWTATMIAIKQYGTHTNMFYWFAIEKWAILK